jgi:ribokinase
MKIIDFGSLNIDYVYQVDHFVQPGETIMSNDFHVFCGGKGLNQSIAASRAGTDVYHAGLIGKDGILLKNLLCDNGVNVDHVMECDKATGHAMIQVNKNGQNSIILYSGANYEITPAFIESVLSEFDAGDLLLLQNEVSNVGCILETAHKRGLKIAFNPSPMKSNINDLPLNYVDWFIINEIEGHDLSGQTEPVEIADTILQRYPDCAVVLTLGKKGVLYKDAATARRHGVYKVKCIDTTGAGDTFTGYFISGIARGLELEEILKRASIASSIAVSRQGASVSIPNQEEVTNSKLELES